MLALRIDSPRRRFAGRPSLRLRRKEGSCNQFFTFKCQVNSAYLFPAKRKRGWSSEAMTGWVYRRTLPPMPLTAHVLPQLLNLNLLNFSYWQNSVIIHIKLSTYFCIEHQPQGFYPHQILSVRFKASIPLNGRTKPIQIIYTVCHLQRQSITP